MARGSGVNHTATGNTEERSVTSSNIKGKDTMTNTDKKQWSTPRLRIFARTRSEENVLVACKFATSGSGYTHIFNGCWYEFVRLTDCSACQQSGKS